MTKTDKLRHCAGCRDDFYNGKNSIGVHECWNLESARVVKRKFVPIHMAPPYDSLPARKTLSCHKRQGFVVVKP